MNESSIFKPAESLRQVSARNHLSLLKNFCVKGHYKNTLVRNTTSFSQAEYLEESESLRDSKADISTSIEESSIVQSGLLCPSKQFDAIKLKLTLMNSRTNCDLKMIRQKFERKETELTLLR